MLLRTFSISTIWHSSSLWVTFCSLPWQLQSITFIYGQWPWLCYFLKLFLNVIKSIQHLIHNVPFFFVPPIPSRKCGIFSIQWCVCIQGYVKLIKLCSHTKVKMPWPTFAFHPFKYLFMKTSFIALNITILKQMSLWVSNLVHSKPKLFAKSYKLHFAWP